MNTLDQAEKYFRKGKESLEYQNYEESLDFFNKAINLKPNYDEAFIYRDLAIKQAIEVYTEAILGYGDSYEGYYNRGRINYKIKDYEKAIDDFTYAIRINPGYAADSYYMRGVVYAEKNDNDNAIKDFTLAIRYNPDNADAYYQRGIVFDKIKKYKKALKDYNKAIELDPNFVDADYEKKITLSIKNKITDKENTNSYKRDKNEQIIPKSDLSNNPENKQDPNLDVAVTKREIVLGVLSGENTNPFKIDKEPLRNVNEQIPKKSIPNKNPNENPEKKQVQINKDNDTQKKEEREKQFNKMKMIATSLFIFMAIVFLFSHIFESSSQILPYIKAFAEAAMIGALADWFAVVALFRKPLGFPYHTAIIPNNKDKMGESLGDLVQNNFLTPENILKEFKSINMVEEGINLMKKNEEEILKFVYKKIPELLNHVSKEDVKNAIIKKIEKMKFTNAISEIIELLTNENKHQDLLNLLLDELKEEIVANKGAIVSKIKEYEIDIPIIPNFHLPHFAANWLTKNLISYLNKEFSDIKNDPFHVVRKKVNSLVSKGRKELKENIDLQNTLDDKIRSVILNKVVLEYFDSIWLELKKNIEEDLKSKDSRIKSWINSAFYNLIEYIEKNEEVSKEIDASIKIWVKEFLIENKEKISKMISNEVKETPKQKISDLIESYVGKDLQFIRINGTIIGGLVGLLIFVLTKFI